MARFNNPFKTSAPKDDFDTNYYGEDSVDMQDDAIYSTPKAEDPIERPAAAPTVAPKRTGYMSASSAAVTMKLMKPTSYQEGTSIADQLMNNCAVVMNLENTNKETASNLIYFLSGVIYAINGHMKPVSGDTYMLTPNNMEIAEEGANAAPANEGLDAYGYNY
jgi:cell division inhibitor SepF